MKNELTREFLDNTKFGDYYIFNAPFSPLLTLVPWSDADTKNGQTPFPILMMNSGQKSFVAISESAYKKPAIDSFKQYMNHQVSINDLRKPYEEIYREINNEYDNFFKNDKGLKSLDEIEIIKNLKQVLDNFSGLITRTLFIETVDRDMCLEAVGDESLVEKVWDKATHPAFESFDSRRKNEIRRVIREMGDTAAEYLRYIYTDYYKPKSIDFVRSEIEKVSLEEESEPYHDLDVWRKTLSIKEKEIVDFIQYVMEARDLRKDPIAKAQLLIYLYAEELAKRAGIPEEYISTVSGWEYLNGTSWLKQNTDLIKEKSSGQTFLLYPDKTLKSIVYDYDKAVREYNEMTRPAIEKYFENMSTKGVTKQEGNFSSLIFLSLLPECFAPYSSRYYDFDFGHFIFAQKQKYGILFFDLDTYMQTSRISFERFLKAETREAFPELQDYNDATQKIIELYDKTHLFDLDNQSEASLVDSIQEAYKLFWNLLSASIFSEAVYEDLVKELYETVGGEKDKFKEFFSYASLPAFESFSLRFDKQLISYLKDQDIQGSIWIFSDYYDAQTKESFLEKINKLIEEKNGLTKIEEEIGRIEKEVRDNKEKQVPYYETLTPELKKLFDYMQISMELRDIRKNPLQRVITLIAFYARAIFNKSGLPLELTPLSNYEDFFTGFYKNKNYIKEIKKRQNCVVFCNIEGLQYEFSDPDIAIKQIYKILEDGSGEKTVEIKGNSACKGFASGVVKIILSENDFGKFTEGDILVTSMTRPEFVSLMKKAKAVITDEGGITCHAAIISRELNIPCVIGTKMATRLLKDGDRVDIDATLGIIKII